MIKTIHQKSVSRIFALLLTLCILLSSLASCNWFVYVAESKSEIADNVSSSVSSSTNIYVSEYLRDWGMPKFDTVKFVYFEECFIQKYNYEGGMSDTHSHAKETAELFLEYYYDNIDVKDKTAVTDGLLSCYVASLDDPYSVYRPPVETEDYMTDMSGKFGGIGVMVEYNHQDETIMVSTVYPGSPAEAAGIKVGDLIYAVDGRTVTELGYQNAVNYVRGEIGTNVSLTLIRGGDKVEVTATRAEVEEINVAYDIDSESNIAYVQIVSFKENTYLQFVKAIDEIEKAGAAGIVFDLRGNPGGYLDSVVDVISYIIPTGKTIVTYQYKGMPMVKLESEDDSKNNDHIVSLPFVVLCNEYTASAGEIFTAALRDYRNEGILEATIVGTTTYKKGIMQNTYYYMDHSTVTLTVAYYNPPCGVNYHGVGVEPDVIIQNNETEDLQLKVAYSEMEKLLNDN